MCYEHAGSVDSNQFASAHNALAPIDPVEGANHDGYRKKRNFGTVLFSFTKIHYFTFLSCTDLYVLHLYKDPSYMFLSEMIEVSGKEQKVLVNINVPFFFFISVAIDSMFIFSQFY